MTPHVKNPWRMAAGALSAAACLAAAGCGPEAREPGGKDPDPAAHPVTGGQPLMGSLEGHDYLFVRSAKNWADAKASCESLGYGLVTVNSAAEQAWLKGFEGANTWWLGINDIAVEGTFVWSNGTSTYTNWGPGQPDNYQNNDDCGLDNWTAGRWDDGVCSAPLYYICESPP